MSVQHGTLIRFCCTESNRVSTILCDTLLNEGASWMPHVFITYSSLFEPPSSLFCLLLSAQTRHKLACRTSLMRLHYLLFRRWFSETYLRKQDLILLSFDSIKYRAQNNRKDFHFPVQKCTPTLSKAFP